MKYVFAVCAVFAFSLSCLLAQTDTSLKRDSFLASLRTHINNERAPALAPLSQSILLPKTTLPILWGGAASISALPLLWPGLQTNVIRVQQWPTFTCTNIIAPMGPVDNLWQLMDDGGLIRMNGSNLEYEAPAILLR
ncbi:MAG: hypothetical protein H7X70_01725 [Candidatus Kapabacteria bacterium]|nr:hypothetical protein [Candidatus Kapabacteria bacterium]